MDYIEQIKKGFLFKDIASSEIDKMLSKIDISHMAFERGSVIYSPKNAALQIGFVVKGTCEVKRLHSDGSAVPLNILTPPASFGIISVLNEGEDFPTHIIAKTRCEVAFISKEDLHVLIRTSNSVALNVCRFLAGRVAFLNDKVTTFSGTSCEKKLASELLQTTKKKNCLEFLFNRKRTAEAISCGRASLYRALDTLKTDGIIDYANKKIYIIDLEGLERIAK